LEELRERFARSVAQAGQFRRQGGEFSSELFFSGAEHLNLPAVDAGSENGHCGHANQVRSKSRQEGLRRLRQSLHETQTANQAAVRVSRTMFAGHDHWNGGTALLTANVIE